MPTVLLMRRGKVERRADAADVDALDGILALVGSFASLAKGPLEEGGVEPAALSCSPESALLMADELERRSASPVDAQQFYERALREGEVPTPGPAEGGVRADQRAKSMNPFALRARLGLLRCAMRSVEQAGWPPPAEAAEYAAAALRELQLHHVLELQGVYILEDADKVARFVSHAELLIDAWLREAQGDAAEVLHLYAMGQVDDAVSAALQWYERAASDDIEGLAASYCLPDRLVPDRPRGVAGVSLYAEEPLARELHEAPGPAAARAMLRRLFGALGPAHESVFRARAELEFLVDKKPWVPFHTRRVELRHLDKPKRGQGTGKRSGYSKRYWLAYGPGTKYKNSKKMGSPHCDVND